MLGCYTADKAEPANDSTIYMSFLDNQSIDITCPSCHRSFKESVGRLKQDGNTCPSCGLRFETSGFRNGVRDAERVLDNFKREMSKTIKINLKF